MTKREWEREEYIEKERNALNGERAALERRLRAVENAVDTAKDEHAREVQRLEKMHGRHQQLADEGASRAAARWAQENASLEHEIKLLKKDVARYKAEAMRARKTAKDRAAVQTAELRELRGELHHLRRVTTERQLELAAERQALLAQVELQKKDAVASRDRVASKFRGRVKALELAITDHKRIGAAETGTLLVELHKAQRVLNEQERQHKASTQSLQSGMAILRNMEEEREAHACEERGATAELVQKLQKHCTDVERIAAIERASMQSEIELLRSAVGPDVAADIRKSLANDSQRRGRDSKTPIFSLPPPPPPEPLKSSRRMRADMPSRGGSVHQRRLRESGQGQKEEGVVLRVHRTGSVEYAANPRRRQKK